MSASDIIGIIGALGHAKAYSFSCPDFSVNFQPPEDVVLAEGPRPSLPDDMLLEQAHKLLDEEAIKHADEDARQRWLDQLMLEDPEEYERQIAKGKIV